MTRRKTEGAGVVADLAGELASAVLPGLGAVVKPLTGRISQEWARQRSVAMEAAERSANCTREEIAEAIAEDPRLVPLVTRMLYAAGMNGHDRTLAAMGAAFGDAVRERESIDECELILASLADLTDHHAEVLLLLSTEAPNTHPPVEGAAPEDQPTLSHWFLDLIRKESDLPERVVSLCVAGLVARGLVHMAPAIAGRLTYEITGLGRVLLEVLEQHSTAKGQRV